MKAASSMRLALLVAAIVAIAAPAGVAAPGVDAPTSRPSILKGVGIDQHLGAAIPPDLIFHDEQGNNVRLLDLTEGKPVVLSLVYYKCPMLCTVVLDELLHSLQKMPLKMHQQYNVLTVSFDPTETPQIAEGKKRTYVSAYGRAGAKEGWHFLTGDAENIKRLTDAVGFHYRYDKQSHQYVHPSGVVILSPDGHIMRYFFGIDYDPFDLRLSLVDASRGKVGALADTILLCCYQYDPSTGRYGLAILRGLKVFAVITLLALGTMMTWLIRKDRRRTAALLKTIPSQAGEDGA